MPSSVIMADVAGGTLNSSAANFNTAVKGVFSGTLSLQLIKKYKYFLFYNMLVKLHVNKIIQIYEVNRYFSCFKLYVSQCSFKLYVSQCRIGNYFINKTCGKNFFILFYAKITFMK